MQDGIVVAEEDERNFVSRKARLADAVDEIEDACESRAGFQSALRGALDGGPIRKRVAEGDAEFDDVGTGFCECQDVFQ